MVSNSLYLTHGKIPEHDASNYNIKNELADVCKERDDLLKALTDLVEDLEMRSNWKTGWKKGIVDCGDGVYMRARMAIDSCSKKESNK